MALYVVGTVGGLTDIGTVTLHIASLWPRVPLVVEADPDGGRLAVRHDWDLYPGLADLVSALGAENVDMHKITSMARVARSGVGVIVAPPSIEQVEATLGPLSDRVARLAAACPRDVLVDIGVLRPGSAAREVARVADRRIIVVRRSVDDIVALAHRRAFLETLGHWSVLTAGGSLRPADVAGAVQWPIIADLLPSDRRSAQRMRAALARFVGHGTRALVAR